MMMYIGYLLFMSLVLIFFCSLCSVGKEYDEEMFKTLNDNLEKSKYNNKWYINIRTYD
jgi:hypothetical protein